MESIRISDQALLEDNNAYRQNLLDDQMNEKNEGILEESKVDFSFTSEETNGENEDRNHVMANDGKEEHEEEPDENHEVDENTIETAEEHVVSNYPEVSERYESATENVTDNGERNQNSTRWQEDIEITETPRNENEVK